MNDIVTHEESLPALASAGQLVTVRIGGQLFGFPVLDIKGIVEAKVLTPVPLAPSPISGMMNLRGRPIAVLNLQDILDLPDLSDPTHRLAVTAEDRGELYALLVDEIDDFGSLAAPELVPVPPNMDDALAKYAKGVCRLTDDQILVLDVARLLDPDTVALITSAEQEIETDIAHTLMADAAPFEDEDLGCVIDIDAGGKEYAELADDDGEIGEISQGAAPNAEVEVVEPTQSAEVDDDFGVDEISQESELAEENDQRETVDVGSVEIEEEGTQAPVPQDAPEAEVEPAASPIAQETAARPSPSDPHGAVRLDFLIPPSVGKEESEDELPDEEAADKSADDKDDSSDAEEEAQESSESGPLESADGSDEEPAGEAASEEDPAPSDKPAAPPSPPAKKVHSSAPLCERIGGDETITQAVERLYDQIWRDKELAGFYSALDMVRQYDGTANLIAMSLGGPDRSASSGVSVRQAILGVPESATDIHFDTWLGYLGDALLECGAPEELVPEAVAAFETYRGTALSD